MKTPGFGAGTARGENPDGFANGLNEHPHKGVGYSLGAHPGCGGGEGTGSGTGLGHAAGHGGGYGIGYGMGSGAGWDCDIGSLLERLGLQERIWKW